MELFQNETSFWLDKRCRNSGWLYQYITKKYPRREKRKLLILKPFSFLAAKPKNSCENWHKGVVIQSDSTKNL
jgi:hypothetical protein